MKTKRQLKSILFIYLLARDIASDICRYNRNADITNVRCDENIWLDLNLNYEYGNDGDHEGVSGLVMSIGDLANYNGAHGDWTDRLANAIEKSLTEIIVNRYDSF